MWSPIALQSLEFAADVGSPLAAQLSGSRRECWGLPRMRLDRGHFDPTGS